MEEDKWWFLGDYGSDEAKKERARKYCQARGFNYVGMDTDDRVYYQLREGGSTLFTNMHMVDDYLRNSDVS